MTTTFEEARSTIPMESMQEALDAEAHPGLANFTGLQQYQTPDWFAQQCQTRLGVNNPSTILDPECGEGALVKLHSYSYGTSRFGIDLDNRLDNRTVHTNLILANIVKVDAIMRDVCPDLRFVCINANPPFGKRWKHGEKTVDSTKFTWDFVTHWGNCGYLIANDKTLCELGLNNHPWKIRYEVHPANSIWKGLSDKLTIGVVFWKRPDFDRGEYTNSSTLHAQWENVKKIVDEEKLSRPAFNIFLGPDGYLRTYLSTRKQVKDKLDNAAIQRLHKVNNSHPLSLTTEKETRHLMRDLVTCGIYTIQPEAKAAIENALNEVNALACPIMGVTDFESVAYCDEEEELIAHTTIQEAAEGKSFSFTKGKSYKLSTGSYKFTEKFSRNKVHFDEESGSTYSKEHECQLSGSDRYIQITDDNNKALRFMDRPRKEVAYELPEKRLWEIFKKPDVKTVAELRPDAVTLNQAVLRTCELMSGYRYYAGQIEYLKRVATKDCGLIAADVGTGKTLAAISLIALKGPDRALIVAPQGTMRSSESEDEDDDEGYSASQWVQELNRFAPFLQVWELFSYSDYERIKSLNDGQLPPGVYISYFEGMFSNGAKERCPATWDDERLNKYGKVNGLGELEAKQEKSFWCDTVGKEVNGVRCILEPCLSTIIGDQFDMVIIDESHRCKGLTANVTQMLIRMQPKYRWALSATPIANTVIDLFPIVGWLCVPGWYKGELRNAAWPYARNEIGRFGSTFLTQERDFTQEADNRKKDPKNRGPVVRDSPVISSPARLLKLLKPTIAYLGKPDCCAEYVEPKVIDVRVPMGREQSVLYAHFLDRANVKHNNPLRRAQMQSAYLRGICTDPKHFKHGGPTVSSNMNPKVIAILELVRDILARGEQVVIVNSRVGISDTLQERLVEAGVSIARIDSTVLTERHAYQSSLFKKGKARCLIMGLRCANSYSFDSCTNLIVASLEYTYGNFAQAKGRIDRVTSRTVKNIYCVLHKNSIEEVMYEIVSLKGDASTICLRGQRVPREFRPVDSSEVLAMAIERADMSGSTPESQCENQWPKLCKRIADTLK